MIESLPRLAALGLLSWLAACGDDTGAGGAAGGDGAGGGGGAATTATTAVTTATSTATSTAGAGGAGGDGASGGGGGAGSGGDGGAGGGSTCPEILISDDVPAGCAELGPLARGVQGEVACTPGDVSIWPVLVYTVDVEAGDCLYVRADDVGAPAESDLFASLVDPGGASVFLDDGRPCSSGGDEPLCPSGGATIQTTGVATVMVGAFESEGCPAGGQTPFELVVSVGGVDVEPVALCTGDLLEIIP